MYHTFRAHRGDGVGQCWSDASPSEDPSSIPEFADAAERGTHSSSGIAHHMSTL